MAEIIVKISPDGSKTDIEVNGVAGASCEGLTEDLLQSLGGDVKSERTSEYYQTETVSLENSI